MATDYVIHEHRETFVLYNKKFQKLVDNCKEYKRNEKAFGKLLGYIEPLNLLYMYYNTDMKKELQLLEKMKKIDSNIKLEIVFNNDL
jgi:hypothetical protein